MLGDVLRRLVTPVPPWVRDMGYLREQGGLRGRHARCRPFWEPHLERTRQVLRTAIGLCARRHKAVVFGSGPLLDVPLPELAAAFREVVLVDVAHPLGAGWQLANVTAVAADVTGVVEATWEVSTTRGAALPRGCPTLFTDDPDVDLVASVNLLSQLPSLPCRFLKDAGVHPHEEIDGFGRDLVLSHLDYLRRLPGVAALVCDRERLTLDRRGRLVRRDSALWGAEFPWQGDEWTWDLAPRPEADPELSFQRRVVGIPDVKRAAARPT